MDPLQGLLQRAENATAINNAGVKQDGPGVDDVNNCFHTPSPSCPRIEKSRSDLGRCRISADQWRNAKMPIWGSRFSTREPLSTFWAQRPIRQQIPHHVRPAMTKCHRMSNENGVPFSQYQTNSGDRWNCIRHPMSGLARVRIETLNSVAASTAQVKQQ